MSVGVICCKVLEKEMCSIVQDVPAVTHIEVMVWGLHARPDLLLGKIRHCILDLQDHVDTTEGSLALLTETFERTLNAQT